MLMTVEAGVGEKWDDGCGDYVHRHYFVQRYCTVQILESFTTVMLGSSFTTAGRHELVNSLLAAGGGETDEVLQLHSVLYQTMALQDD